MSSISPTDVAVSTGTSTVAPAGLPYPARSLAREQQYPVDRSVSIAVSSPLIPKLVPSPKKKRNADKKHKDLIDAAAGLLLVRETAPRAVVQGVSSATNETIGSDSLAASSSSTAVRQKGAKVGQIFAPGNPCHFHAPVPRRSFSCLLEIAELDRKFMFHQPSTEKANNHLPAEDSFKKRKSPAVHKGVKRAKKEMGSQLKYSKSKMDKMPVLSSNESNMKVETKFGCPKSESSKPTPCISLADCKAALKVMNDRLSPKTSMQSRVVVPSNLKIAPRVDISKKTVDTPLPATVSSHSIHQRYQLDAITAMAITEELKMMQEKPVSAVSVPVAVETKQTRSENTAEAKQVTSPKPTPKKSAKLPGILSVAKQSKIENAMSMAIAAELKQLKMTNASIKNLSSQVSPHPAAVGSSSVSIENAMAAKNHMQLSNQVVNDVNIQVGTVPSVAAYASPKSKQQRQAHASKKSAKTDASKLAKIRAKLIAETYIADDSASVTAEQKIELTRAYRCASTARHRAKKKEHLDDMIKGVDFFRAQLGMPPREAEPKNVSRAGQKRPDYNPPAEQMANMTSEEISEWKRTERLKRKREKAAITMKEESERLLKLTIEYEQLKQMYTNSVTNSVKPEKPGSTTKSV